MKMLVDLNHPVDVNFFKNAIAVSAKQHEFHTEITLHRGASSFPFLKGNYRTVKSLPLACTGNPLMGDEVPQEEPAGKPVIANKLA
jgi:hypothetical protein